MRLPPMCTLLVLLLVLHCFALCNARDPLRITRLFAWARLKGAYIHSCLEYRDAGMYTTCTIPPNTLLTCVPNELILDPEVPKNETRGTVFARVLPSADESHPLWYYIDTLPKTCQIPACRPINRSVVTRRGAKKIQEMSAALSTLFGSSQENRIAFSVSKSRKWSVGMVPVLDLFNHNERLGDIPNKNRTSVCLHSGNISYHRGDEVFNSYGAQSHFHWYKNYGFVPSDTTPTCNDMTFLRVGSDELRADCIANTDSTIEEMTLEYVEALMLDDTAMIKGASRWLSKKIPNDMFADLAAKWFVDAVPKDFWGDVVALHLKNRYELMFK